MAPISRRAPLLVAAAVALFALFAGCSARDRANPLDPANPSTTGRPSGFTAVALSDQVLLSWGSTLGLSTQVWRRADGEPGFTAITGILPANQRLYTDSNAPNGVTYHYLLYFVTPSGLSPPASADATPSKVIAWAVDRDRGSLLRLSADGREIATEQGAFGDPVYLAIDRAADLLWVADYAGGRIVIYHSGLGWRVSVPGYSQPSVIAVAPDGSAWISDYSAGVVRHVLSSGGPGTPSQIANLDGPLGVDVDPQTHSIWVCERNNHLVRRYAPDGAALGNIAITLPSRVAADSATGEAWVTSFETNTVFHVSSTLDTLHAITGLAGPVGIAVDPRRGRIWVADPAGSRVVAYRRDGTEEFRVGGLTGARDLAVEPASGEAWVATSTTVVRIGANGSVLATTRGLSFPAAVALDRVP